MFFLSLEAISIGLLFLVLGKYGRKIIELIYPLTGCLYVVPFNQVDDKDINTKKDKKKGGDKDKDELIDYQLGAVVGSYENMQKFEGMPDYDFSIMLLFTAIGGLIIKLIGAAIQRIVKTQGIISEFLEDQNVDVYLVMFIVFSSIQTSWKILYGLDSMRTHRRHSLFMALFTVIAGMFLALGSTNNFFVGDIKNSVNYFNIGAVTFLQSVFKDTKSDATSTSWNLLSETGLNWISIGLSALMMLVSAPGIIKLVDCLQVYKQGMRKCQDALDRVGEDEKSNEANKRLLSGYKLGWAVLMTSLVLQAIALILHVSGIAEMVVGKNRYAVLILIVVINAISIGLEAYSTKLELKSRSQHVFELLVHYKPKDKMYKELFVRRCHSLYKESLRHMLSAYSKAFLPFLVLLLVVIFLRKSMSLTGSGSKSNEFAMRTIVENNPYKVLMQAYICPNNRAYQINRVIRGYGVCQGVESIDIHSKTPFAMTEKLNLGYYLTGAFLDLFRSVLFNFQTSKWLLQLIYIVILVTTNEDFE